MYDLVIAYNQYFSNSNKNLQVLKVLFELKQFL